MPVSKFIAQLQGNSAALAALNSFTAKTVLAPSDFSIGNNNLTEAELLGHIFQGRLTSTVLASLSQIFAVSGERYNVTVQEVPDAARSRRLVTYTVANNVSRVQLTVLDVPSGRGVVHSVNGVLRPDNATANAANAEESDATLLGLVVGFGVLILLLLLLLFCWIRNGSRRARQKAHGGSGEGQQVDEDYFEVVDNVLRQIGSQPPPRGGPSDAYGDWQQQQPKHFYPRDSLTSGNSNVLWGSRGPPAAAQYGHPIPLGAQRRGHPPPGISGHPPGWRSDYVDIKSRP